MSWRRIALLAVGGGLVALGVLVPAAGPAIVAAGMGAIGVATNAERWLSRPKPSRQLRNDDGTEDPTR